MIEFVVVMIAVIAFSVGFLAGAYAMFATIMSIATEDEE